MLKNPETISVQIYVFLQIEHTCATSTHRKSYKDNKTPNKKKKIQNITSFPKRFPMLSSHHNLMPKVTIF